MNEFLNEFDSALLSDTEKLRGWKLTLNEKKNTIVNLDETVLNLVEILRKKGKCFNCLRSAHIARDCPSKSNCYKCNQRHHTSLCDLSKPNEARKEPPPNGPTKDPVPKHDASTSIMYVNSNTAVLLQTAKANVYRPDNDHEMSNVRVI